MWPYIIGFIVIVGIIVVVMNRRGSTGAGRPPHLLYQYMPWPLARQIALPMMLITPSAMAT